MVVAISFRKLYMKGIVFHVLIVCNKVLTLSWTQFYEQRTIQDYSPKKLGWEIPHPDDGKNAKKVASEACRLQSYPSKCLSRTC